MNSSELAIQVSNEWTVSRDLTVASLAAIKAIDGEADYSDATDVLSRAKKLRKELEAARKSVTSRIDAIKKSLIADERKIAEELDAETERVNAIVTAYATEQMRRREEEQRRIEAEAARRAEAEAAAEQDDPFGVNAAPVFEPEPVATVQRPRSESSSVTMVPCVELVDESKVPREFLSYDQKKVNAFIKYQKSLGVRVSDIRIEGLRITEVASVRSR